ncbi:MAG: hypothetical protein COA33_014195 [Fluviicola sp.]|nr:hypothetical protein [Fluviicola sp.]
MNRSEKRYFKVVSSRHSIGGKNNYTRLFDAIDKQSVYDEERLFKLFEGESFLKLFSITKKRLYDHILSALDSFHTSNCTEAQLYKMLHSVDILYDKSLYEQSKKILRSAEKLAIKHEKNEILLIICNKNKRLLETQGHLLVSDEIIDEVHVKVGAFQNEIELRNKLWTIKAKLFVRLSQKGISRSEEDSETYGEICKDALTLETDNDHSLEVKYLLEHIKSAYHYAVGDLKSTLKSLQGNIELFSSDTLNTVSLNKQISVVSNAIYVADKLGLHKESNQYLEKLKQLEVDTESNEDMAIKLFSSISSIELDLHLRKGDFERASEIAQSVEDKLLKFDGKIIPIRKAFLSFKMAVIHMGMGDFNKALNWINVILNDSRLDKTEDIVGYAQLLDLLIHVELDNQKLLPYSLKNTMRFFKTRNRLYGFETIFLQFIQKLINCDDRFEIESIWEELNNELANISDDSFESVALEYFDFKSWAEAKLQNKSFDSIVKEKYYETIRAAS